MAEIKVGDIVRVSEKIPQFYRRYNSMRIFEGTHKVVDIEDGLALLDSIPVKYATMLPTKYLIKVNAEPRFHKGDKVRISCAYDDGEIWDRIMHGRIVTVKSSYGNTEGDIIMYKFEEGIRDFAENWLEPYTDPKEPTGKPNFGKIAIPVEADLTDSFWDAYTADLAKEIVLKRINCASDQRPSALGAYAVSVAKSVVENLKKREE